MFRVLCTIDRSYKPGRNVVTSDADKELMKIVGSLMRLLNMP